MGQRFFIEEVAGFDMKRPLYLDKEHIYTVV